MKLCGQMDISDCRGVLGYRGCLPAEKVDGTATSQANRVAGDHTRYATSWWCGDGVDAQKKITG